MTTPHVPDEGTGHERLCVIGEAPGAYEEQQGRPFVGPSGRLLAEWMTAAGLTRTDAYWTNVVPRRPPNNDLSRLEPGELGAAIAGLKARLAAALVDPIVLVPTGATSLRAILGLGGISKHRGSVYDTRLGDRLVKVIPTLHPAAVLRTPGWAYRCRRDWRRIAGDLAFRDRRLPEREHLIRPSFDDVRGFVADAEHADVLAVDIETPRKRIAVTERTKRGKAVARTRLGDARVTCVGVALSASLSMTIPTTLEYWHDPDTLAAVWVLLRQLGASPVPKALQNGLFDTFWLADHDVELVNWLWDTRDLHHGLRPNDEHSLAYMASLDTREPYWKDDGKGEDPEGEPLDTSTGLDTFWTYCSKDAAVTWELADTYAARYAVDGRLPWYHQRYTRLRPALRAMMRGGIALDDVARRRQLARLQAEVLGYQDRLTAAAGEPLHGTSDLSPTKLARFLYETLRLPRQTNRATKQVTTNELAIRRLALRHRAKFGEAADWILGYRRAAKLATFLDAKLADPDGRVRASFGWTETWRLTSSKSPRRTGANLFNIDRAVRGAYVPDPGHVFLEADLSTAESRVVYCLTGDPALIAIARSSPEEFDDHTRTATMVFGLAPDAVWHEIAYCAHPTKEQRYLAKRVRHASHYGMRGATMSDGLLKDGVVRTPEECDQWIERLLDTDAPIRAWQRAVRIAVLRTRRLTNSWDCTIDLADERLSDDLYREAYAWRPQSEIGCLMLSWGVIPLHAWLTRRGSAARLVNTVYDSVLVSTPPDEAYDLAAFLAETLERPRVYDGVVCTIPLEFKLGRTWQGDVGYKRLPDRATFTEAARTLARPRGT